MTITAPQGFRAAGIAAGLKSSGNRDLALVINDGPLDVAAAVFTTNRVFAAPVAWSRSAVSNGRAQAVVLNSGGANACTGAPGLADSEATAQHASALLGLSASDILVCSTGLIGVRLPMDKVLTGLSEAVQQMSSDGGDNAAEAIMTTDTVAKTSSALGSGWVVGGMAKGAGMLAPGMATMLSVITTDAVVDSATADSLLRAATSKTFDRVDSDGCMSTNDTVILLASGASGVTADTEELGVAIADVCADLARKLVSDAEGATHDIAVEVVGADSERAAVLVARAVTRSNLFKTAIYGNDPNWGRVLSAVGTVSVQDAPFDASLVDVSINGVQVCQAGGVGEDRDLVDLAAHREVRVHIDLHAGQSQATVWTNDLTHDYVHENSAYSS